MMPRKSTMPQTVVAWLERHAAYLDRARAVAVAKSSTRKLHARATLAVCDAQQMGDNVTLGHLRDIHYQVEEFRRAMLRGGGEHE
jgi:hypothetical protein